ncbi:hypothetical protein BC628DRAFT_131899 [Trametes gibbosa]|nr:hypothetical protein BC628DRAFT_131899 [Trametes gibbosa]
MPRFLDTWTGEFVWKNDPAKVRYAILSHTWRDDGGEQTYADVLKIQADIQPCSTTSESPFTHPAMTVAEDHSKPSAFFDHPQLSEKIVMACKIAREAGFKLIWIDTCCIDKSSSAELAEAINSMYSWYGLSDMCYAFLADVPDGENPTRRYSAFRGSRWHKRGWTLQELIASERVTFLTKTWSFLGTKRSLATLLEQITRIEFDILIGRAPVDSVSVAQRMAWAAMRETTRIEDRAYSLLGIFGVHMAPIYGEGENAFLRLQEEILRTVPDQTVFIWDQYYEFSPGLLATSPSFFKYAGDICVMSPTEFASRLRIGIEDVPPLHAIVTPQGVRIKLLCLDLHRIPDIAEYIPQMRIKPCDKCGPRPHAHLLALLQCQYIYDGPILALPLCHPPPGLGKGLHIGIGAACAHSCFFFEFNRRVYLSDKTLRRLLKHCSLSLFDLSILHHRPRSSPSRSTMTMGVANYGSNLYTWLMQDGPIFEFDTDSVQELATQGFHLSPLSCTKPSGEAALSFTLSSCSLRSPLTANLPCQKILVDISLACLEQDDKHAVRVEFSAAHFTIGPLQASHDSGTPPGSEIDAAGFRCNTPLSVILDTPSGTDLGRYTSTYKFDHIRHYTVSHAEFAVYTGPPEQDKAKTVRIRWLKVSLQHRKEDHTPRLYIAVELSGVHAHAKPCVRSEEQQGLSSANTINSVEDDTSEDLHASVSTGYVEPEDLFVPLVRQPTVQALSRHSSPA